MEGCADLCLSGLDSPNASLCSDLESILLFFDHYVQFDLAANSQTD